MDELKKIYRRFFKKESEMVLTLRELHKLLGPIHMDLLQAQNLFRFEPESGQENEKDRLVEKMETALFFVDKLEEAVRIAAIRRGVSLPLDLRR